MAQGRSGGRCRGDRGGARRRDSRAVDCGGARVLALARRTPRTDPAKRSRAVCRGDRRRLATRGELWTEPSCPYEAALALADTDEEEALRRALDELQRLEARPAAALVARRLRERGARGLPRGPRAATRRNPGSLTPRELEVLGLVAEGLRNAEIAERRVLSERTPAHHVAAILRKLGVHTRGEATAKAARLGLAGQDR